MAKYTMTLNDILRSGYKLWDFDYPCIAGYRSTFERKFELEFHDREINFLSVDEFKVHLQARLNLIMPYYVQLQKSERLIDNPFRTYKMMECTKRNDDDKTFMNSVDTAALNEGVRVTDSLHQDVGSVETMHDKTEGTDDGILDRDTTDNETVDYTSKQVTNKVVKTTDTEDGTESGKKDTKYEESTTGSKITLFSDMPQKNFVIGNVDESGDPISSYATTYTRESTTGHKQGTQSDTTEGKHHIDKTGNEDTDITFDQTDKTTKGALGTVDDVTHGEHEETEDRKTDFNQNTQSHQQTLTGRSAENTDVRHSDRITRSEAITSYGYEGYKQVTESQMLQAFRATFLNIDREIFRECETLFLGVY